VASLKSKGVGVRGGEEEARAAQESRGGSQKGVSKGRSSRRRSKSGAVKRQRRRAWIDLEESSTARSAICHRQSR
jgi:hypothetical protein